jgi:hypothetical protein
MRAALVAPVAQLDRASVYGTEGRRFESSWARYGWLGGIHTMRRRLGGGNPRPPVGGAGEPAPNRACDRRRPLPRAR